MRAGTVSHAILGSLSYDSRNPAVAEQHDGEARLGRVVSRRGVWAGEACEIRFEVADAFGVGPIDHESVHGQLASKVTGDRGQEEMKLLCEQAFIAGGATVNRMSPVEAGVQSAAKLAAAHQRGHLHEEIIGFTAHADPVQSLEDIIRLVRMNRTVLVHADLVCAVWLDALPFPGIVQMGGHRIKKDRQPPFVVGVSAGAQPLKILGEQGARLLVRHKTERHGGAEVHVRPEPVGPAVGVYPHHDLLGVGI